MNVLLAGRELLSLSGESNAEVGDYSVAQRLVGWQQRASV